LGAIHFINQKDGLFMHLKIANYPGKINLRLKRIVRMFMLIVIYVIMGSFKLKNKI